MKDIWGERTSRYLICTALAALAVIWVALICAKMPPGELSSQNVGPSLADGVATDSYVYTASDASEASPIALPSEVPVEAGPATIIVTDVSTNRTHVYPPTTRRIPCSFGYKHDEESTSHGCVTRGKFAVGSGGVWNVACKLGSCWMYQKLCVYLPRPPGWGDKMLLPAEIENYRALPKGAKAGAC
jgi:hypothetical protein